MGLWEIVGQQGCRSVSVIGMVKNAGKTVTLNRVIAEANGAKATLGLTSSGRDGEREDVLWRNPKPAIWAPRGTFIATAKELLPLATASLQLLKETRLNTPLGPVCVTKVIEEGQVELAGPSIGSQLVLVTNILAELGADLVLVDGAMDRVINAAPTICEGVILASGAGLEASMEVVLQKTLARVEQLTTPGLPVNQLTNFQRATGAVNLWYEDDRLQDCNLPSALGHEITIAASITSKVKGLFIRGALTDRFLGEIGKQRETRDKLVIVVNDPTKILATEPVWRRFKDQGGSIKVLRPIKLLALTINPWSPCGWQFDPKEFLYRAKQVITQVPVFDLYQPEQIGGGGRLSGEIRA